MVAIAMKNGLEDFSIDARAHVSFSEMAISWIFLWNTAGSHNFNLWFEFRAHSDTRIVCASLRNVIFPTSGLGPATLNHLNCFRFNFSVQPQTPVAWII